MLLLCQLTQQPLWVGLLWLLLLRRKLLLGLSPGRLSHSRRGLSKLRRLSRRNLLLSLLGKLCLELLLLSLSKLLLLCLGKLLLWSLRLLRLLLLRQLRYRQVLLRLLLRLKELLLSCLWRLLLLSGSLRLIISSEHILLEEGEPLVVSE